PKVDLNPTGMTFGEARAQRWVWSDGDPTEQILNVLSFDAIGSVLCRRDLAVKQGHGHHVRKRMVGLLLRRYELLVPFLSPTDDVVSDLEDIDIDSCNVFGGEVVLGPQLQDSFERRLRMDLCVVLLEDGHPHPLQVFPPPVDLEGPGDGVHETLVALEHLERTGDAAHGEERGV